MGAFRLSLVGQKVSNAAHKGCVKSGSNGCAARQAR